MEPDVSSSWWRCGGGGGEHRFGILPGRTLRCVQHIPMSLA